MQRTPQRRGFSMLGLLISLVCVVVLSVILMQAMDKAVTGEGSNVEGTVYSTLDKAQMMALYQGLFIYANEHDGHYLEPSEFNHTGDRSYDTTANFYSALIAGGYIVPKTIISPNEYNPYVEEDEDYDQLAYNPGADVYWDESFAADLDDMSNASYAHLPMYGERFERAWGTRAPSHMVIFGTRGPKDGVDDIHSWTYGNNQTWGGTMVFGDGAIEFIDTFTPGRAFFESDGQRTEDNLFRVDDGLDGGDSVIAFTRSMSRNGPELQFD
jgi:hypothetical protein